MIYEIYIKYYRKRINVIRENNMKFLFFFYYYDTRSVS